MDTLLRRRSRKVVFSREAEIKNGKWDIDNPKIFDIDGLSVKTIRQDYGQAKRWSGFCGGSSSFLIGFVRRTCSHLYAN